MPPSTPAHPTEVAPISGVSVSEKSRQLHTPQPEQALHLFFEQDPLQDKNSPCEPEAQVHRAKRRGNCP